MPDAPLEMPAPPPRSVEPVDVETPQPVPLPEEPVHRAPPRRPAPPRPDPKPDVKPEPPKADTPPVEPPKPVEEPPKPPTLQMTPAANEAELERSIRTTLARANTDLKRVDFGRLNAEARTQYDFANRYIQQAEDALGKKISCSPKRSRKRPPTSLFSSPASSSASSRYDWVFSYSIA